MDPGIDAILVAAASDSVLEAARRLAAEGKPLLLWPHGEQTAFVYELSLVHNEVRTPLSPVFPLRFESAIEAVRGRLAAAEFGRLLHLKWERSWPTKTEAGPPLLTPTDMEETLADADLLRSLGGNYDRVTALRRGSSTARRRASR